MRILLVIPALALALSGGNADAQYYQPCCGGIELVPQWQQQNRQFEADQARRQLDDQRRQVQEMENQQRRQQREIEGLRDCQRSMQSGRDFRGSVC